MAESIDELRAVIDQFAEEREWDEFHTPKNLAMAVSTEAAELLEVFQWLTPEESFLVDDGARQQHVREEVADVFIYLVRLCSRLNIDLAAATGEKLDRNAGRYTIARSRGNAKKVDR